MIIFLRNSVLSRGCSGDHERRPVKVCKNDRALSLMYDMRQMVHVLFWNADGRKTSAALAAHTVAAGIIFGII